MDALFTLLGDQIVQPLANLMVENVYVWLAVNVAFIGASVYVAMTTTKETWWYKAIEKAALIFGKAKDKAPTAPKKKK